MKNEYFLGYKNKIHLFIEIFLKNVKKRKNKFIKMKKF
jgi:hypothetical protein